MIVSKSINKKLYEDISNGDLVGYLQTKLIECGSKLLVSGLDLEMNFLVYARIEKGDRSSQIYLADQERLFIVDYWRKGVNLGKGATKDIKSLCESLMLWIENQSSLSELSVLGSWIFISQSGYDVERGKLVEMAWSTFAQSRSDDFPELKEFLEAASKNVVLRRYYPYTSMNTVHFSRCTGYPFTHDIAYVVPRNNGLYEVKLKGVGYGVMTGEKAVECIVGLIPKDWGPAIDGTASDVK